jgi:hypothetical protein
MTRFVNAPNLTRYVNAPSPLLRLRYFLGFDAVLNSYGQLETAWQPTGSFKIKAKFSTTSTSDQAIYARYNFPADERSISIHYDSGDVIFAVSETGVDFNSVSVSYTPAGKFSTCLAEFTSNTSIKLTVDGVTATESIDFSSVHDADTPSYFGSRLGSSFFLQGVPADIELIDLDTPANSQAYRLDRATGTTESSLVNTGTLTYNNIPESKREQFKLVGATKWINISPAPQQLPAVLEVP